MEKEIKIKTVGKYNGHSVKANRMIDLSLKLPYDEMVNYIQSLQLLNENVTLKVKIGDEQGMLIGTFMIGELKIDGDGEGVLKLKSNMDNINANEVNRMAVSEPFKIALEAKIDVEEQQAEGEEEWDE